MPLNVAPQGPIKLIRKYKLSYQLKDGTFQELFPSAAEEGVIDSATNLLGTVLSPTAAVSQIHIIIGNNANTNG